MKRRVPPWVLVLVLLLGFAASLRELFFTPHPALLTGLVVGLPIGLALAWYLVRGLRGGAMRQARDPRSRVLEVGLVDPDPEAVRALLGIDLPARGRLSTFLSALGPETYRLVLVDAPPHARWLAETIPSFGPAREGVWQPGDLQAAVPFTGGRLSGGPGIEVGGGRHLVRLHTGSPDDLAAFLGIPVTEGQLP